MNFCHSVLRLLAVAAVFAIANAGAAPASPPSLMQVTRLGVSTTDFSCAALSTGTCNYLILTSLCQEKLLDNGVKERTCRYSTPIPPFQLQPGGRKTVTNLPSDYLYLMKMGSLPTAEEVLQAPQPH